jgi:hypothetical protein
MNTTIRAFEPSTQAAEAEPTPFKGMSTFALADWMEEQQEEAEIRHLRRQIRTNGRVGVMELY